MSPAAVLAPVFAQIALTFALLIWMGWVRVAAIQRRELHIRDIALDRNNWPLRVRLIGNAYQNQLELPLLFYMLVLLMLVTGHATLLTVALSWLFVAFRLVHVFILVTDNNVPRRFYAYNAGFAILLALWIWFFVALVAG